MQYFTARGGESLVRLAQSEPSLVDGLSYPLTLAFALQVRLFELPFVCDICLGTTSPTFRSVWACWIEQQQLRGCQLQ